MEHRSARPAPRKRGRPRKSKNGNGKHYFPNSLRGCKIGKVSPAVGTMKSFDYEMSPGAGGCSVGSCPGNGMSAGQNRGTPGRLGQMVLSTSVIAKIITLLLLWVPTRCRSCGPDCSLLTIFPPKELSPTDAGVYMCGCALGDGKWYVRTSFISSSWTAPFAGLPAFGAERHASERRFPNSSNTRH